MASVTLPSVSGSKNSAVRTQELKGLILAGGKGTRLRPLTYTAAKQLLPVANKPILFYALEAMMEVGISEVGIVVGDTKDEVMAAIGDGSRWGLRTVFIPQEAPLGLAHAVKISREFLGTSSFLLYLGDNLLCDGVREVVRSFQEDKPNAQILLARVKNPQQFGVAELDHGRVVRLEEKPSRPKSDLALVGVYLFDHHVFDIIEQLKPSRRGELEITDAIQGLIDRRHSVRASIVSGWWKDTGKWEDILEANRLTLERAEPVLRGTVDERSRLEGRVALAAGARVVNSVIRGPVSIGERAVIENSYVGPFTSIARDVNVRNSEIENSIVLPEASIEKMSRIESSLIGRGAQVVHLEMCPKAYRFMIGDCSRVEVP